MPDLTLRPTAKFIKAGAVAASIVFIGLEVLCLIQGLAVIFMAIPPLILIWPGVRALRRRLTKTTIIGERLRYETGMASKSTRTIQLPKVQDVRVDQTIMQRLFNVGNLSIETAGEASRLTIHNVDDPQAIADDIINRSQHGASV